MRKLFLEDGTGEKTLLTISIVSHGNADLVIRVLQSIQQFEETNSIQVLITDNLENDIPYIDPFPWASLTIIRNQVPLGFSCNHNQAFQLATGKYYCVINPDVLFEEMIFPGLINSLKKKKAAIVSPLIFDSADRIQDSFREFPTPLLIMKRKFPRHYFIPLLPDAEGMIYPDWIAGVFMLMHSNTYEKIGGFNEVYYLYFEDVDFCLRARDLGFLPLVDTNLRLQHNAQRASQKSFRHLIWHFQSAIRFFSSSVYKKLRKKQV